VNKILFILLLLVFTGVLFSQTDPCEINYKDGKSIMKTRMVGIHENLLLISADTAGSYKIVNTDRIARIKFDNGKYWKTGAAMGAGIGLVGGIMAYQIWGRGRLKFLPKDATLGTIGLFTLPCAIIGGLIGMAFKNIDIYELAKLNNFVKAKEIKFILRDHAQYR
jgi:hypothetical protein